LRVMNVASLGSNYFSASRAGEEEELIRLMRTNVANDAAVPVMFKEPGRPFLRSHSMRPKPDGLYDLSNRSGFNELTGFDCGAVFEALAIHYRVAAPRFGLNPADISELLERSNAGLIGHEILAVLHYSYAKWSAVARNRG